MPFLPVLLSGGYIASVNAGDAVSSGQIIAARNTPSEIKIRLADELDVPPHTVFRYLKKNPGDSFTVGEILAVKKHLLGSGAKVIAKTAGTVTRFERNTGDLFLNPYSASDQGMEDAILSPIEGKIALCNNDKILIEVDKNFLNGVKGSGGQTASEILVLPEADTVELYHLQKETIGKIAVGDYFPREVLVKSIGIGILAIIGTKILDDDIAFLLDRKMQLPIIEISSADWKIIKDWHGKSAYVNGEGKTIILLHG